ncbi:MAG: ATP-binding cassette domain-containing protein, partial [Thermoanaerobaculia bacterium]
VLRRLKNAGNTVIVVEQDPTILAGADYHVELGPGAGELGGEVLYAGVARAPQEVTGSFAVSAAQDDSAGFIRIVNARQNNLRNVTVDIPLGKLVAITGVSGSGKSTLIRNCLFNRYRRDVRGVAGLDTGKVDALEGTNLIYDMEFVDQSPIGRSSRSNPATYIKAWDEVRKLLAETTGAKLHGVTAGMFSFNTEGGRCEICQGAGVVTIDMQFLADVEVVCEKCDGRRFGPQVMKVTFKGKNVNDILQMTVDEASKFFVAKRALLKRLDALRSVGLGYLRLGPATDSLSGGEAQRLKLASFLAETAAKSEKPRLFLFDEPTTGLAATDVEVLIRTFRDLIDRGNSVVVIEHNTQLVEQSDWVIDLGPDGGDQGGEVVALGTPEEIAGNSRSITGRYLRGARTAAGAA